MHLPHRSVDMVREVFRRRSELLTDSNGAPADGWKELPPAVQEWALDEAARLYQLSIDAAVDHAARSNAHYREGLELVRAELHRHRGKA